MSKNGGDYNMEYSYKEVYFGQYCKKCKHVDTKEDEEPCEECLNYPVNLYSHKPVKFEANPNYKGDE